MSNQDNMLFRGYTMVNFDQEQFAQGAVWWAKQFEHECIFSIDEVRQGVEFICLSEAAQKNIALWSGGKRPILIPSMNRSYDRSRSDSALLVYDFLWLKEGPTDWWRVL